MKIKFVGHSGAFAPIEKGNSNMLFISDSGKMLAFDMGTTWPYIYRDEWKADFKDIDALYISHLHSDHAAIEQFAFSRFFMPKKDNNGTIIKPKLFMVKSLMKEAWETTWKGGLESLQGKIMNLTDYFECCPVSDNKSFIWEGYSFTPIQTVHVRSGYIIKHSYGLGIRKLPEKITGGTTRLVDESTYDCYVTSDTMFDPQLAEFYKKSKIIFSDCEVSPFRSHVHPNYDDLKTLVPEYKKKMWLYHYNNEAPTWVEDGFAGFVKKGQEFVF